MARTHQRSPSPGSSLSSSSLKRFKATHSPLASPPLDASSPPTAPTFSAASDDPTAQFAPNLFDHSNIARLHTSYVENEPYKYALVEKLFQDDLLRKVKDECLNELNFTEKETDIYKIKQTGDLASLNYLTTSQKSLFPNLIALRDALYSSTFRAFLRAVTGCPPLSGKKQDMAINSYIKGCHLINHDDVIGTRCVSYILYMPLPHDQSWQKDWGGALELYPVQVGEDGQMEPKTMPTKIISPSWNQFIFFEVQPGRSFHSVEEVVVGGEDEDGRERLSISGWFHVAQEGEEGYVPAVTQPNVKSSREQLTSSMTTFKSYPDTNTPLLPEVKLSEEHLSFLSEFLNPVYLQPRTMKALAARFVEESSLELHSFLCNALATSLEPRLRAVDVRDGLGPDRASRLPPHTAGTDHAVTSSPRTIANCPVLPASPTSWMIKGPPHKWRYCVLKSYSVGAPALAVTPRAAQGCSDGIMRTLQDELFPSAAFRAWLAGVSRLLPLRYAVEARRFRPGLDYTLATSEEGEARLDAVLGLTPEARVAERNGEASPGESSTGKRKAKAKQEAVRGWQAAEWGGWECYMAPHNEEDDPAVYRGSNRKKEANGNASANGHGAESVSPNGKGRADGSSPIDVDVDEEEEVEDEDSTLLTVQPGFNRLLLVLRDERVMRFVKYVSAAAEGSRWDVCGEYEVGMVQADDDDGDGDGND